MVVIAFVYCFKIIYSVSVMNEKKQTVQNMVAPAIFINAATCVESKVPLNPLRSAEQLGLKYIGISVGKVVEVFLAVSRFDRLQLNSLRQR